jgi:uncharacterized protein YjiS (DUF1127 family)
MEMIMSLDIAERGISGNWRESAAHTGIVMRIWGVLRARSQRNREMRELLALDSRMLTDIGIDRAQAEYMATQPYAGDWSAAIFGHGNRR